LRPWRSTMTSSENFEIPPSDGIPTNSTAGKIQLFVILANSVFPLLKKVVQLFKKPKVVKPKAPKSLPSSTADSAVS